jgi:Zn-dependent peptidase ImmA (M78 family)
MLLYHQIKRIENRYPPFNRRLLTVPALKELANHAQISVIEDFSVSTAVSFRYKKRNLIYFNPQQPHHQQILCLGHDIDHFLLGHHDAWELYFNPLSMFARHGMEKDASIVGFLCLLPTRTLDEMAYWGRLDIEEIYRELCPCGELEEDLCWRLAQARMRIYRAFKEIRRISSLIIY